MKVQIDTEKLLQEALSKLSETYTLDYVDYDERLSDEQIQQIFDGKLEEVENEIQDRANDYHWELIADQILPELIPDGVQRAALVADGDSFRQLIEAIEDRNDATLWKDMVRNTGRFGTLMRYHLGGNDDQDLPYNTGYPADPKNKVIERWARKLARMAGVDYATNEAAFRQMVIEQSYYGGQLYVIWYGSPAPLIDAISEAEWQETRKRRRTITWTNPQLVLLDRYNGSGHDAQIIGTITKPWDPERCDTDSKGWGYGWDAVASVVQSAYKCEWSIGYTAQMRQKGQQ